MMTLIRMIFCYLILFVLPSTSWAGCLENLDEMPKQTLNDERVCAVVFYENNCGGSSWMIPHGREESKLDESRVRGRDWGRDRRSAITKNVNRTIRRHRESENWDDKIMSLLVAPGCEMKLYEDESYSGEQLVVNSHTDSRIRKDLEHAGWRGKVSSFKCHCSSNTGSGFSVREEIKNSWGSKKEITLVFKNNDNKAICYSRFKIGTDRIERTWNMDKNENPGEYSLPSSWRIEPGAEYRDSGYIQLSGPVPEIQELYHEYCDDRQQSQRNDNEGRGYGLSIQGEIKNSWGSKKEITLVFRNNDNKAICFSRFKIVTDAIGRTWNMNKDENPQEYILPSSWRIEPGAEYRGSGYIQLSGPVPEIKELYHEYCDNRQQHDQHHNDHDHNHDHHNHNHNHDHHNHNHDHRHHNNQRYNHHSNHQHRDDHHHHHDHRHYEQHQVQQLRQNDNGDYGSSIRTEIKQTWDDKKEITLIFKNNNQKAICFIRFKIETDAIGRTWNINKDNNPQEYVLPSWWRLEPGAEYRESGYIQLSGPVPEIKELNREYCE